MPRAMDPQVQNRSHRHREVHAARQIDRRLAGIGGRIDPGVERHAARSALVIEPGPQPSRRIRSRHRDARRQQQQHDKAQRAWIALCQTRRRPADMQIADAAQHPAQMQAPQFLRQRIALADGEAVAGFRDRPVGKAAGPLQPPRAFEPAGDMQVAEAEIKREPRGRDDGAQDQGMGRPGQRREQVEQAGGREQPRDAARRPQRGPDPLERQRRARPADMAVSPQASPEFARIRITRHRPFLAARCSRPRP